ncbi:MAG: DUF924 family protein [Pseudomonadota bacterium]
MTPDTVLNFWFDELTPRDWYRKSDELDSTIRQRFAGLHAQVAAGETWLWRQQPSGRLAEVIVLDQFSRNMFRNTPAAFAYDNMALALAQEAVAGGADSALETPQRAFLYLPYMHSESAVVHEQAMSLFATLDSGNNLEYEIRHKAIIDQFGRYPYRNAILGRDSTAAERKWMETNSGF